MCRTVSAHSEPFLLHLSKPQLSRLTLTLLNLLCHIVPARRVRSALHPSPLCSHLSFRMLGHPTLEHPALPLQPPPPSLAHNAFFSPSYSLPRIMCCLPPTDWAGTALPVHGHGETARLDSGWDGEGDQGSNGTLTRCSYRGCRRYGRKGLGGIYR